MCTADRLYPQLVENTTTGGDGGGGGGDGVPESSGLSGSDSSN